MLNLVPIRKGIMVLLGTCAGAFHDRDSSSFSIAFKRHILGFFFEVYNSFLPQLASKWRAVESGGPEKVPEI